MGKRIHFLKTDNPLTYDERRELVEQVLARLRELGHEDDVILLDGLSYEGTVQ